MPATRDAAPAAEVPPPKGRAEVCLKGCGRGGRPAVSASLRSISAMRASADDMRARSRDTASNSPASLSACHR
eukprot:7178284-Pyramimonas_sp.AAC.1